MPFNFNKLLEAIHGTIQVPSFYPYFCNLRTDKECVIVMKRFLDTCENWIRGEPWMWFVEMPIAEETNDPLINEWIHTWNEISKDQISRGENDFQTVIYRNNDAYIIKIITSNWEILDQYDISSEQCLTCLELMLHSDPFNNSYVFIDHQDGVFI